MAIPKEYLDSEFDFGFSTADDDTVATTPTPVVNTQDIYEPIIEKLQTLEALVTGMAETGTHTILKYISTFTHTIEHHGYFHHQIFLRICSFGETRTPKDASGGRK
jgi:hypothetical protein